jgi:HK97 family phage major capsid protein
MDQLTENNRKLDEQRALIQQGRAARHTGAVPDRAPRARRGENIMSSRGFQIGKVIGVVGKNAKMRRDEAKIELEFCDRLNNQMAAQGWRGEHPDGVLIPIWPDGFDEKSLDTATWKEMKDLLYAGVDGADEGEMQWLRGQYGQKAAISPSMSWNDQTTGGSFVGPPTFGPPIELLRAKEAMLQAGASLVPLGPTGSLAMPRLAAATTGGWIGENTQASATPPKTGSLLLRAKKAFGIVAFAAEFLRFGSPAAEMIVRNDLMLTVSLVADKGLLDGPGSDNVPLGLATMGAAAGNPYGITIVTPANANQLAPQDVYKFISGIEEANGTMTAWIMRPSMCWSIYGARWTPYSGGTSQGGFMFELMRGMGDEMDAYLSGHKVVRSTQVSNNRGVTDHSRTYILGLNGPNYLMGVFGAIEVMTTAEGWNLVSSDQVAVRALMHVDGGMRNNAECAFMDLINPAVVAG